MRIVITGGAGFLGTRLARAILARGSLTDSRGAARPAPDERVAAVITAHCSIPSWTTVASRIAGSGGRCLVGRVGFEPTTNGLRVHCSTS